jgi:ATPases involved in chromosome partitioning
MRVGVYYSYKGGTGKTTSIINMANNLCKVYEKKVLLVDMDPQCNLTWMFGKVNRLGNNICTVFKGEKALKDCIRKTRIPGIDMVYGSIKLDDLDIGDAEILKRELEGVKEYYDYVLIDCHPAFDWKAINAMVVAQDLIITLKLDQFGLNGLELIQNRVRKCKSVDASYDNLDNIKILVTMAANRTSQMKTLEELLEDEPYPHFKTAITYGEAVNSAMKLKKPLLRHRSRAKVTLDYLAVTKEYLKGESSYEQ